MAQLLSTKDVIKKYQIAADKKLGQNFLLDQNITDKIVRAAGSLQGRTVLEVGPGPGTLTRSILAAGPEKLIAIEKDPRCISALEDYLTPASQGVLEVIDGDALKTDVYDSLTAPVKVIANLPYNVSTELLLQWLGKLDKFESFTLMFQREVAMRLMAKQRTKDYGRLSIKTQWLCEVEHNFDLPPEAFTPPPKVTSSVVTITPRKKPLAEADENKLEMMCKAVFNQRRKTLRSSMKQIVKNPLEILEKAGIDSNRRPEELSVEEFCVLSNLLDD